VRREMTWRARERERSIITCSELASHSLSISFAAVHTTMPSLSLTVQTCLFSHLLGAEIGMNEWPIGDRMCHMYCMREAMCRPISPSLVSSCSPGPAVLKCPGHVLMC
jgi:hypothetical protein